MIGRSTPDDCYLDFGSDSVKVAGADGSTVLPLERESDGSFSPATCARFREVLARSSGRRGRVICGIPARGASLRRVLLPAVAAGETRNVVCLQVEREFPLSPDELAWGFQLGDDRNGKSPPRREAMVVALRRELIEPYRALLSDLDRTPVFRIGSLAACALHPGQGRVCHVDLGRRITELVWCERELPVALRVVTWGGESVTQRIAQVLETLPEQAEHVKLSWARGSARLGQIDESAVQEAVAANREKREQELRDRLALALKFGALVPPDEDGGGGKGKGKRKDGSSTARLAKRAIDSLAAVGGFTSRAGASVMTPFQRKHLALMKSLKDNTRPRTIL